MESVFKEIERMGAYDPLIIKLDRKKFYMVGFITCCNANLELDKNIFKDGNVIQNPNSLIYWKIKSVGSRLKYCYFKIDE